MSKRKTDLSPIGKGALLWRLAAMLGITSVGYLWHYLYDWTGSFVPAAFFFPVNESVWEHLKLGYWPVIVFSVFELYCRKDIGNNYIIGRVWGIVALKITILGFYYGYTCFTKQHVLLADIGSFVAGVVLCEMLTFRLSLIGPLPKSWFTTSIAVLIFIGTFLGFTTYYPPHYAIFMDQNTGWYGLPAIR